MLNAIHSRHEARYQDIAAAVPQASTSTLAETLHALEHAHLLRRVLTPEPASHPLYSLLPAGAKLLSRLRGLLEEVHRGDA